MLYVLISLVVCPKPNTCCDGCCNPNTHCCVGGDDCVAKPSCNPCTEQLNESNCTCIPNDTECPEGQTVCGGTCCESGEVCEYDSIAEQCNCVTNA